MKSNRLVPVCCSTAVICVLLCAFSPLEALAQNTPPLIKINAGLTLNEESTAVVDSSLLLVDDAEQGPANLTFTVLIAPEHGSLLKLGNPLSAGETFTQADVNGEYISYSHDGSETTLDYFTFDVSDGAGGLIPSTPFIFTITPVNDAPVLAVNTGLTLGEGSSATICASALQVTDGDNSPAQLTFTVTTVPGADGTLALSGTPLYVSDTFTQADVNAGFLSYSHDGDETTSDMFGFSFSDGVTTITGNTFNIAITPVNDTPVIVVNTGLTLVEGTTSIISASELLVTDAEQGPANLTFTVLTAPAHGSLIRLVNPLGAGDTFTQADVNGGILSYDQGGAETVSDDFTFSVSDGVGGTAQGTFVFTVTPVNDPPVLAVNNGLSVVRGGSKTITRGQLFADDPDTSPMDVLLTVTIPPSVGTLVLSGSPGPSTFTQDDIDYGRLRYDHNGSDVMLDGFSFELSDSTTTMGPYDFVITVQGPSSDPPAITSIIDVGNDQGRSVLITFQKCGFDTTGSQTTVLEYGAFRRIDPLSCASSGMGKGAPSLEGWVFVGSVPANGESIYNIVAPTLADSTAGGGIQWSVFFIRALTAEPTVYFDSAADSGYSVDNLVPSVPLNLAYVAPGVLTWDEVPDADFDFYTVYGSESSTFDETAQVLGHASTPTFDVQAQTHAYFFVTATDFNGNEGGAAGIANPSGINRPMALVANISAYPNPFNPATTIIYTIENAGPVTVTVYDAVGKLVETLVNHEYQDPNVYRIEYRPRGASGVYFVRLETGRQIRNAKLVLLK